MSVLARSSIETTAPTLVDAISWQNVGPDQYLITYEDEDENIVADVFFVPAGLHNILDTSDPGDGTMAVALVAGGPSQLGTPSVVSAVFTEA